MVSPASAILSDVILQNLVHTDITQILEYYFVTCRPAAK
jgi:hypothetical protein